MNRRTLFRAAAVAALSPLPSLAAAAPKPVRRTVLAQDRGRVVRIGPDGAVQWEAPCPGVAHDIAALPNGNVLIQTAADNVVELDRAGAVVWRWDAKPLPGVTDRAEIHAFQRLSDGATLVAESGNRRLLEVTRDGTIRRAVPLTVERPDPHRDTRRARKLASGNYLVCHEKDGAVREYDPSGTVVWQYRLDLNNRPRTPSHTGHGTEVFNALRLRSGNTLIAGGNANRVLEVDPGGKTIWSVEQDELPKIKLFWVTNLEVLPNGNLLIGNTHAGPDNPQLIEITRAKQVVWSLRDWTHLGNDTAAATLVDAPRGTLR